MIKKKYYYNLEMSKGIVYGGQKKWGKISTTAKRADLQLCNLAVVVLIKEL